MKKVLILTLAISLVVAGIAMATVVNSKHDMRPGSSPTGAKITDATTTQVCVFCHHPHRGTSATVSNTLLWNITDAAKAYNTYADTATTQSTGITLGGDWVGSGVDQQYTLLCMGCHDGSAAGNSFVRGTQENGKTIGTMATLALAAAANLGETLGEDHPVDFEYPSVYISGLEDIRLSSGSAGSKVVVGNITSVSYPLYDTDASGNDTMQCGTCHDVHNGQSLGIQFMRTSTATKDVIAESRICRDCHTAK